MDFQRGSEWRKWDLHFHTPSSYDYGNCGISNGEIIDCLTNADIALVVVTDHHYIDVPRIKELRELSQGKISILPGIEFRSELGGRESVHFIGIFPEADDKPEDLDTLWTHLQGALKITPSDVERAGKEAFYCDFKNTARIIHEEGGIVSVHAGRKSNSVENIKNTDKSKMYLKTDMLNEYVDILEVGREEDIKDYRNIVFPSVGRKLLLVIGSDNHNAKQYEPKTPCWINADPTFFGLKQTLVESEDRVFIGDLPPKLRMVAQKQTKYINGVKIHKVTDSPLDEVWFDNNILLNSGLVAIIGNKGSGKSALLDILGLMGNSHRQRYFPFLNEDQFCKPSLNKAKHFDAELAWIVGDPVQQNLDIQIDSSLAERVKYIPQNFFEEICNEIVRDSETEFDRELQSVIFSHVSEPKRLGFDSLAEIIAFKTREMNQAISSLELKISRVNHDIEDLEVKLTDEYEQNLRSQLQIKEEELRVHEEQRPKEVALPEDSDRNNIDALTQIEELKDYQEILDEYIEFVKSEQRKREKRFSYFERIMGLLQNFVRNYNDLLQECDQYQTETQINIRDFIDVNYKEDELNEIFTELQSEKLIFSFLIGEENSDSLFSDLPFEQEQGSSLLTEQAILTKQIESIQSSMTKKYDDYQNFVTALEEWNERRKEIVGDEDTFGSLNYIARLIKELETIPEELEKKRDERINIVKEIYGEILKLSSIYKDLYRPVQDFISNHPLASGRLFLNFDVAINILGFEDRFFDWISHNSGGTFYTKDSGRRSLASIIAKYDFNSVDGVVGFLEDLLDNLTNDKRSGHSDRTRIKDQLRKGKDLLSFYDFVFSLSYLKPRYILKLGEKEINQLSPGEKGALLLIFYLLVDKDDQPLLIDQPEHNLDNQTVYDLLVPCIKEAKQKRQIIMVTHNPNLAVVCDAEQIICASLEKKDKNTVTYISGSLENPLINQKVIDILEGTKPAFNNRESKYQTI